MAAMGKASRKKEQRVKEAASPPIGAPHRQSFLVAPRSALLVVLLLSLLVNLNVLANGFGWDDETIIKELKLPEHWWSLLSPNQNADPALKTGLPYFRPAVSVSYLVDKTFWENNPFGFHFSVLLAHLLNTGMVFFFARRLMSVHLSGPLNLLPFLAASLFAVHPAHAEAVAWIAGRNDLFCTTFLLISMLFYLRFHRTRHWIFFGLSMLVFFLALLTKETAVGLVLLFPLYEYLSGSNDASHHRRRIGTVMLISLGIVGIYIWLRMTHIAFPFANASSADWFSSEAVRKIIGAYGYYLKLMVFPYPHNPFIMGLPDSPLHLIVSIAAFIFLLGGILTAWSHRSIPLAIGLAWAFCFLALPVAVAVLNFAVTTAAERYAYIPSLGFLIAASWLLLRAFEQLQTAIRWPARPFFVIGGLLWVSLITIWGWESWNRNAVWRSPQSFWKAAIVVTSGSDPREVLAHNNLGGAFADQGRFQEAAQEYRSALKLNPGYADTHFNLGALYKNMGRMEEAIEEYQTALKLKPGYAIAHYNLGTVYEAMGRLEDAIQEYQMALKSKPDSAESYNNLGVIYRKQKRLEEAVQMFQSAVKLDANIQIAHYNLALAYTDQGKPEEAIKEYQMAIRLKPDDVSAHNNLGNIYVEQGKREKAIEEYQAALRLDANHAEPHYNLGVIYAQLGKLDEAKKLYQQALQIKPDFLPAQKALDSLSQ